MKLKLKTFIQTYSQSYSLFTPYRSQVKVPNIYISKSQLIKSHTLESFLLSFIHWKLGQSSGQRIAHGQLPCFGKPSCNLSLFLCGMWGRTTTSMVMIPPGTSLTGDRDSASVLSFSSIFPALISFTSFIVFGPFTSSWGNCESIISFRDPTVVLGLYLLGPISLPSANLNFTSISSWEPIRFQPTSNSHITHLNYSKKKKSTFYGSSENPDEI